jgi:hypothetical protein
LGDDGDDGDDIFKKFVLLFDDGDDDVDDDGDEDVLMI